MQKKTSKAICHKVVTFAIESLPFTARKYKVRITGEKKKKKNNFSVGIVSSSLCSNETLDSPSKTTKIFVFHVYTTNVTTHLETNLGNGSV